MKEELRKNKSSRERELLRQVERLMEQKYVLEKEVNSAKVARDGVVKQLEDAENEMEELKTLMRQKVIRSAEYIELRERYRLQLTESKWLR